MMDMGLAMTIMMVAMMALMMGGIVWGAIAGLRSRVERNATLRDEHARQPSRPATSAARSNKLVQR